MTTKHPCRSEALGAIHETMEALHRIGAINKITMREFDEACLAVVHERFEENESAEKTNSPG